MQPREGALFVTEPFDEPVELAGRLRGELDFTVNKYDVDLVMTLYELRSHGEYVKLFEPGYAFRASYARDRVNRRLLPAGVRQQLPFQSDRMVGRKPAGRQPVGAGARDQQAGGSADQLRRRRRRQRRIARGCGRAGAHPLARRQLHRDSVTVRSGRGGAAVCFVAFEDAMSPIALPVVSSPSAQMIHDALA